MYCEICRRPVCHLCNLSGSHANHRVTTMTNAYKTLKEKLTKGIGYLISKESQVKTQITELEILIRRTESNGDRAVQEATYNFDKLFNILEDRKAFALLSIKSSQSSRLEKLQSQLEEYQGLLENNGLVGYAQEVLKIQKALVSLKTFHPAANSTFEDYLVDISKGEGLLKDLSFSKALEVPQINMDESRVYDNAKICWSRPNDSGFTDGYILEYRKLDKNQDPSWNEIEASCPSKVVSDLDLNSSYCFRVQHPQQRSHPPDATCPSVQLSF
ncbi:unnamed protein product [Ranitomeya imitator]|uniref:B box-type domain-containing protein n=1 Tax=Ranitomeya imitator TaxID=111125 RepID=A0ABN9M2T1_9NEOB|nr:unnamed protein product [Ranitomeya imitator]